MSWNLHSQDEHTRRGETWVYWTFRCSNCRRWLTLPSVGPQPQYLPRCLCGAR